jgi:hypothetical protein
MATESEATHRLTEPGSMRIGLFIPCHVDMLFPEVGIATLELLELFSAKILPSSLWTAHRRRPGGHAFFVLTKHAQPSTPFPGIARDVRAHLHRGVRDARNNGPKVSLTHHQNGPEPPFLQWPNNAASSPKWTN